MKEQQPPPQTAATNVLIEIPPQIQLGKTVWIG